MAYFDPVVQLSSGRTINTRMVQADRLMSRQECGEVAAALRQRISLIESRLQNTRMTDEQKAKAEQAVRWARVAWRDVLARGQFLARAGDQHVELMSDAAMFVQVAKQRLGREVFDQIMAEAKARSGVSVRLASAPVASPAPLVKKQGRQPLPFGLRKAQA